MVSISINKVNRRYSGRTVRPLMPFERILSKDEKVTDENGKKKTITRYRIATFYPLRDGDTKSVKELDVDTFPGQPFMKNANGFITNDIMMFEQCQSDSVARAVLSRLKVLHPESLPQDMSLDDMMASSVPANYGSPAEFVNSQKMIVEKMYKLHEADRVAYQQKIAEINSKKVATETTELERSVPKNE